jgi:hypothetical protein
MGLYRIMSINRSLSCNNCNKIIYLHKYLKEPVSTQVQLLNIVRLIYKIINELNGNDFCQRENV